MSQQVYKLNELTIDISASSRTNIITNTTFFTMDVETAKKVINFTLNGERFDLTNATVLLGFDFVNADTSKIIDSKDGSVVIESAEEGRCSVILPNHLYQYSGRVYIHAYIMFDGGRSFDAGIIVTEFKESWLDSELEEMSEFYVKRFEDLAREIREHANDLQDQLNNLQTQANEIQDQITSGELVTRPVHEAHVNDTNNPHQVTIDQIPALRSLLDEVSLDGHTHTIAQVTNLQTELDNRALIDHTHTPAQIGAAPTGHTHAWAQITNPPAIPTAGTTLPLVAGTANVGNSAQFARANHVHPAQTTVSGNAGTATALQTTRTINGTSFNGSANITTASWGVARNITIGNSTKPVNGGINVGWTLAEIGAAPVSHTHPTIQVQDENPDLNDYKEEGTYYFEQQVVGVILNTPPNSVSGWLTVAKGLADHDGNILVSQNWRRSAVSVNQVHETWTRVFRGGTWTDWTPIAMFPWQLGATEGIHQSGRTMFQFGSVTLSGAPLTTRLQQVDFARNFGATPNVQLSVVATDPTLTQISHSHNSTSGFQINLFATHGSAIIVRWFAAGAVTM